MARVEPREFAFRTGERFVVRTTEPGDAAALMEYSRRELHTHDFHVLTPEEFTRTEEEQRKTLEEMLAAPGRLALMAEHEGRLIGELFFRVHDRKRMSHHGHFGISTADGWRGRGVGRALITTLLDWAAAAEGVEKVCLGVFANNERAIGLYKSLGFVEECRRRKEFKFAPGRYIDDIQMHLWVKPVEGETAVWRGSGEHSGRADEPRGSR